ncbi:MAG: helix-turn-helix domain-containing protein [Acidobacteria bacterium]|nr:helix-turn-helix domain-containing protein [Acidobacteriota bacterium]
MTTPGAETAASIDAKDLIAGLGRGLAVIESLDDAHPRLTATEAARRVGHTRTAARRHLLSLCHFGYAQTDGKLFWLAPRVLRLGQSYLSSSRLPRLVQPFIQRASTATGETVNVSVLDGHEVVYIARSNSPRLFSSGFHAGARAPAHVVAPGVVLLSQWPDDQFAAWVRSHEFAAFTPHTVTKPERFVEIVQRARTQAYWITTQQLDAGLLGVAVPLLDLHGHCHAAIGATVQAMAYTADDVRDKLVSVLQETARLLRPIL